MATSPADYQRMFGGRGRPAANVRELSQEIATTGNGRDITVQWMGRLREPSDRRLWGAINWGEYARVRQDDQVASCMQQRIYAHISRPWEVIPGDETPLAQAAADALEEDLQAVGWDRLCEAMLWSRFYGYSVAEAIWEVNAARRLAWKKIVPKRARRFRWGDDDTLRLLTRENMLPGEALPPNKFWVVTSGMESDADFYGQSLAELLYWPVYFKRGGIKAWNIFLDKLGVPTVIAKYRQGATLDEINKIMSAIRQLANDSGMAVPSETVIELLETKRSISDFGELCRYMDGAIAKIILSQTMTTDHGSSRAQAQTHQEVKLEIVKADADLLCDSFNTSDILDFWTRMNFGNDCPKPMVARLVKEERDIGLTADADYKLWQMGWQRSEDSFQEVYGDGWERVTPPAPAKGAAADAGGAGVGSAGGDAGGGADDPVIDVTELAAADAQAAAQDAIDLIVARLDAGWQEVTDPLLGPLIAAVQAAGSFEEVDAALNAAFPDTDHEPLMQALERAGFAVRALANSQKKGSGA
ncbi:MAG: DUF935 family protein [Sphingomonadaceae bacterium]|nr:DUF935 family protein [Sphingomonadaceae bacterium]